MLLQVKDEDGEYVTVHRPRLGQPLPSLPATPRMRLVLPDAAPDDLIVGESACRHSSCYAHGDPSPTTRASSHWKSGKGEATSGANNWFGLLAADTSATVCMARYSATAISAFFKQPLLVPLQPRRREPAKVFTRG